MPALPRGAAQQDDLPLRDEDPVGEAPPKGVGDRAYSVIVAARRLA